jgi:hypothetical protein
MRFDFQGVLGCDGSYTVRLQFGLHWVEGRGETIREALDDAGRVWEELSPRWLVQVACPDSDKRIDGTSVGKPDGLYRYNAADGKFEEIDGNGAG